ncbi:hypothetical protein CP336_02565 [Pseudomonas fluorescens]|jgi:hypothetical protein|nr:hypothetical protein CP336_02565 [Pseudomonas fluorescens]
MRSQLLLGALSFFIMSSVHAQTLICPKAAQIDQVSTESGTYVFTAPASKGTTWMGTGAEEFDLKTASFTGAKIDDPVLTCDYKDQSDRTMQLTLKEAKKARPVAKGNWKENQCSSEKLTLCAFNIQ